jgi:hypothetical protein
MLGPGKYDEECTLVRERTKADGVILLVFNGNKGFGLSCQLPRELLSSLPSVLRRIALDIEVEQLKALSQQRNN